MARAPTFFVFLLLGGRKDEGFFTIPGGSENNGSVLPPTTYQLPLNTLRQNGKYHLPLYHHGGVVVSNVVV